MDVGGRAGDINIYNPVVDSQDVTAEVSQENAQNWIGNILDAAGIDPTNPNYQIIADELFDIGFGQGGDLLEVATASEFENVFRELLNNPYDRMMQTQCTKLQSFLQKL
jgi:hypothetical protein